MYIQCHSGHLSSHINESSECREEIFGIQPRAIKPYNISVVWGLPWSEDSRVWSKYYLSKCTIHFGFHTRSMNNYFRIRAEEMYRHLNRDKRKHHAGYLPRSANIWEETLNRLFLQQYKKTSNQKHNQRRYTDAFLI